MKVLVTLSRFLLGGSETYTATVGEELERLGHEVTVHAGLASREGGELLAARGLRLEVGEPPPLEGVDVVLAQDAANAYMLAGRRPALPQAFVIHGLTAYEHPPARLRPPGPVIVLNDRVAGHAATLAAQPPVIRLRQPIDLRRFRPPAPPRSRARRVLLLSNYLAGARLRALEDVCDELGLELLRRGALSTPTTAPEEALAAADIVIGYGRSVLEGMAMGRAAYVWDHAGGDGWVTPETYPEFEADGFSGAATDTVIDADRLRADLGAYRPALGEAGIELVRSGHAATAHAEALEAVLVAARPSLPEDDAETLAQLVRAENRAAVSADRLEAELRSMLGQREEFLARTGAAEAESDALMGSRSLRATAALRRAAGNLRRP